MSDIRARLADALREHGLLTVAHADKLADVLLSLPGIAIVDPTDRETIATVAEAIRESDKRFHRGDPRYFKRMARASLIAAAAVQAQEEQA